ncbi:MAG: cytidine deaminase [Bacteroidetes bacterium]|nr:MAG: cytidine deaminase [Bacteroidota bacterium]
MQKQLLSTYEEYDSIEELNESDRDLLMKAREATRSAYAPYSQFKVGAAAKLANGEIIRGSNQENASFPAGICAERVLLSSASSFFPSVPVETIAISYQHKDQNHLYKPIAPCGICRQTLQEYELRFHQPIRIVLGGMNGKVYIIPRASNLLPLSFDSTNL